MSNPIERVILREPVKGHPKIIAIFSFRYDEQLVPALIENITPLVHGYAAWDDRGDHGYHANEPARRNALNAVAIEMGADWILGIDPDERIEERAANRFPLLTASDLTAWQFNVREMVTEKTWRCDGLWGTKRQTRLYPASSVQRPLTRDLHGEWFSSVDAISARRSGINLYHLRHIDHDRAVARRNAYAKADPDRSFNSVGYDYLVDPRGQKTEAISGRRRFLPVHQDDRSHWGPMRSYDSLASDPDRSLLVRIERSLRADGAAQAGHTLDDLVSRHPEDQDFLDMRSLIGGLVSPMSEIERAELSDLWRRWVTGPASIENGKANGAGPLSVVVMSFKAQESTRHVVSELLRQSRDLEIIVVNSGGGSMRKILEDMLPLVRLIEIDEPLVVGSIRNIGIDASIAPYVAFLAADCIPTEGWVAARLARHRNGGLSFSSAVLPERSGSLVGEIIETMRFPNRGPLTGSDDSSHFGRSYNRRAFQSIGYFAPLLQIGEDTEFNQRLDSLERPVWAPEIAVRHRDPTNILTLMLDQRRRAKAEALSAMNSARSGGYLNGRRRIYIERMIDSTERFAERPVRRILMLWLQKLFAELNLREIRRIGPRLDQANLLRASAQLSVGLGQAKDAIETARSAVALDRNNPEIWHVLGLAQILNGDPETGFASFLHALELGPGRQEGTVAGAKALSKAGRDHLAAELIDRALMLAPITANIRTYAARRALNTGDLRGAREHALVALLFQMAKPEAHNLLADIYESAGKTMLAALRRRSAADLTS